MNRTGKKRAPVRARTSVGRELGVGRTLVITTLDSDGPGAVQSRNAGAPSPLARTTCGCYHPRADRPQRCVPTRTPSSWPSRAKEDDMTSMPRRTFLAGAAAATAATVVAPYVH